MLRQQQKTGCCLSLAESAGAFAAVSTVDDHWERKQGSGQAGPSYAKTLSATLEGQQQLQELRRAYSNALKRKEQVRGRISVCLRPATCAWELKAVRQRTLCDSS